MPFYDKASGFFADSLEANPDLGETYALRAWMRRDHGDPEAAARDYDLALEKFRNAKDLEGHFTRLGRDLRRRAEAGEGTWSKASLALRRAMAINRRNPLANAQYGRLLTLQAARARKSGASERDVAALLNAAGSSTDWASKVNPRCWEARLWRGQLFPKRLAKRVKTALSDGEAVTELRPELAAGWTLKARALRALGRGPEAAAAEAKAARLAGN